jgi:excisionase family DNA binding protein
VTPAAILPLMYTVDQAARAVGVSRGRFYEFINSGEIPSVKIGNRRRIRASDLETWVKNLPVDESPAS